LPDPRRPRSILPNLLQVGCQKSGSLPIHFLIVHPLKPTSKLTDIGKKTVEFRIRSLLHCKRLYYLQPHSYLSTV